MQNEVEIFTKTIKLRNGKILRASDYGKVAFRFIVSKKDHKKFLDRKKSSQ